MSNSLDAARGSLFPRQPQQALATVPAPPLSPDQHRAGSAAPRSPAPATARGSPPPRPSHPNPPPSANSEGLPAARHPPCGKDAEGRQGPGRPPDPNPDARPGHSEPPPHLSITEASSCGSSFISKAE